MRTIKSYVRRAGRMSKRQEQGLSCWLKDYELTLEDKTWDFSCIFDRNADTIVEIGFGMGVSLLKTAQQNPHLNYVGIEVHEPGVGVLAADLHDHGLTNVRLVKQDAIEVIKNHISPGSLAGIQLFFPDPWPKKRHHKRRIIQSEFVKLMAERLKDGGFIHCATDWEEYAHHMLSVLSKETLIINKDPEGGFLPRPMNRPITKFEERGNRLGHGVWDLVFIKQSE